MVKIRRGITRNFCFINIRSVYFYPVEFILRLLNDTYKYWGTEKTFFFLDEDVFSNFDKKIPIFQRCKELGLTFRCQGRGDG